ncbi:hypothetical protein Y694_04660 [Methylibium sp. T29-B]|nr:hypothetical protein Y694_04660 [Methylibium sp. T29-B]
MRTWARSTSGWSLLSCRTALPFSSVVGAGVPADRSGASSRARSSRTKCASSCETGRGSKGVTWALTSRRCDCITTVAWASKRLSGPAACSASVTSRAQGGTWASLASTAPCSAKRARSGSGAAASIWPPPSACSPFQRNDSASMRWVLPASTRALRAWIGAASPGSCRRSMRSVSMRALSGSCRSDGAPAAGVGAGVGENSTATLCAASVRAWR